MPIMTTPSQALRGRVSYDPPKNDAEKGGKILMRGFSSTQQGLTLVKRDGAWEALSAVSHFDLEAAESYYLGGHQHEVSLEVGAELVAAGMVTEVIEGEEVSFVGVPNWSAPFPEEPEEEPEGPEDG